ncbi:MAG: protein-L-isoaspartate(D-aspartate) O-methyltransferase [Myxococcota bacterium]
MAWPLLWLCSYASGGPSPETDRARMVRQQLRGRDITSRTVLEAMRTVPRHRFVPDTVRHLAYVDEPLPIGHEQTISQPYIVALMTQLAELSPGDRVLEIGTGSGYQAAILAAVGADVYSIEIVQPLGQRAARILGELGYDVHLRIGDGYPGWPEAAPFRAILLTAAPAAIPEPLKQQLAVGGRLVAPVGGDQAQELVVLRRTEEGFVRTVVGGVRFVPMTGEAAK